MLLYLTIQAEFPTIERAKTVHDMRSFIRGEETAIRGNSTVFKKLWTFIEGVVDGSAAPGPKVKSTRGRKRKDADEEAPYSDTPGKGKKGKTKA